MKWHIALILIFTAHWITAFEPLSAERCETAQNLVKTTEAIRGLRLKRELGCEELSESEYQQRIKLELKKESNENKLQSEELLLKTFALIPENYAYVDCYYRQRASVSGAYYDPPNHKIVLPNFKSVSDDILVHEITHALQEDHFQLHRRSKKLTKISDLNAGWNSLLEGDAILTQELFIEQTNYVLPKLPPQDSGMHSCEPPESIIDWLFFPYNFGRLLAIKLYKTNGFAAINQAYKVGFAPTTRDVMHRTLTNKNTSGPKWNGFVSKTLSFLKQRNQNPIYADSLGQYFVRLILGVSQSPAAALRASKGWKYDQIFFFKGANNSFVWDTTWDNSKEALEFYEALVAAIGHIEGKQFNSSVKSFLFQNPKGSVWYLRHSSNRVLVGYSRGNKELYLLL